MDKNEVIEYLTKTFQDKDWFAEAGIDVATKRITVYVHKMNAEVYESVPSMLHEFQIMLAFVGFLRAASDKFTEDLTKPKFGSSLVTKPVIEDVSEFAEMVNDGPPLIEELDRLEKICGSNMLQDIFYEVHDGKNAVTNLSSRFPEVREALETLYANYGFDVLYEELDG